MTAAFSVGSPAIFAEAIHTLIDTCNQGLLLFGVKYSLRAADAEHNFGYGRGTFVYSMISACSLLFVGAGVTAWHGIQAMIHPAQEIMPYGYIGWGVLSLSFVVDAWVLQGAVRDMNKTRPQGMTFLEHYKQYPEPAMRAIVLEDMVATSGALIALAGMTLTHWTSNPIWDGFACTLVGTLLGATAVYLIRWNKGFLLGKAVDPVTTSRITAALTAFPSVEGLARVKSRWEGPETFAYQCEIDFNGRVLADSHVRELKTALASIAEKPENERDALLTELLRKYGEDIVCSVENEVANMHAAVRLVAPKAEWVEILPRTKKREMLQ